MFVNLHPCDKCCSKFAIYSDRTHDLEQGRTLTRLILLLLDTNHFNTFDYNLYEFLILLMLLCFVTFFPTFLILPLTVFWSVLLTHQTRYFFWLILLVMMLFFWKFHIGIVHLHEKYWKRLVIPLDIAGRDSWMCAIGLNDIF